MAAGATVYRVQIALSDVDRGVYEALDLRVAQHPSETARFLLTRLLAYALAFEPGLEFSKGLSTSDEPAAWVRRGDGSIALSVEVGAPSAARLHKASKASDRVIVFTHHDPETVLRAARERAIHRASEIELVGIDGGLLEALEARLERNLRFELVRSDDRLYVTIGADSLDGALTRRRIDESE